MSEKHSQLKPFCSLAYLAKSTAALSSAHGCNNNDTTLSKRQVLTEKSCIKPSESISENSSGVVKIHNLNAIDANMAVHSGEHEYCSVDDSNTFASSAAQRGANEPLSDVTHRDKRQNNHKMQQGRKMNKHNCFTLVETCLEDFDCWDYMIELDYLNKPQDLQLAAELGKTLLERNKELELLLKENKIINEEQQREIMHLRKQINAMTEVNDSRLKVYEQLEVGIQDLERTNHRLNVEKTRDKKQIKSLTHNIEILESRSEEYTKQIEELRQSFSNERRKYEQLLQESLKSPVERKPASNDNEFKKTESHTDETFAESSNFIFEQHKKANSTVVADSLCHEKSLDLSVLNATDCSEKDNDEIVKIVSELESHKRELIAEQQRCMELEEQLVAIIQENQKLQGLIAQTSTNEEMMSMHDEFSILDEVRQGQMCSRCLRAVEERATNIDDQSSVAPTEDNDDEDERYLLGMVEGEGIEAIHDNMSEVDSRASPGPNSSNLKVSQHHPNSLDLNTPTSSNPYRQISQHEPNSLDLNTPTSFNPYRDLVEKYEALLEVQRKSAERKSMDGLTMGYAQGCGEQSQVQKLVFQSVGPQEQQSCSSKNVGSPSGKALNGSTTVSSSDNLNDERKTGRGRTPTDYSEAETSSSGFSDETSNKYTQTDERPGYFLCSIGDGEDCKFSIYDDVSPIDSRFRNKPQYRELFKEIFAVLKKAAENKDEGERLPLLDDTNPHAMPVSSSGTLPIKVPPVTPATEELPLPLDFADDTQSIISSAISEQSFAMSECITKLERKTAKKHIVEKNQENKPPLAECGSTAQIASANMKTIIENGRVLTPFKREPLEYVTIGVGIKKKNRRKNRGHNSSDSAAESPLPIPSTPRFFVSANTSSGKRGRKERIPVRNGVPDAITNERNGRGTRNTHSGAAKYEWNGSPMVIYNRNLSTARASRCQEIELNGIQYGFNTVSQEFHKLKKLDLSYAEVLRRADTCDSHSQQRTPRLQQHRRRSGNNINNNHHHH